MKKFFFMTLLLSTLCTSKAFSATSNIVFYPANPIQGEPVMIVINNAKLSEIASTTIAGKLLKVFEYQAKPTAFYGIDVNKKPGPYEVVVNFKNGTKVSGTLVIAERKKNEEPFSIPEKLGGDTTASQKALVTSLAQENAVLNKLKTFERIYWNQGFVAPLSEMVVSDEFGYSRKTGGYVLTHKGTDFKAKEGTKVFAMNDGVVKVANVGRNYGKHIVIDHGLGVMTFYLHLSKMNVRVGEKVARGQLIGLSGQTGYAAGPHLHLSIRIYNVSVDPVTFLEFFK